MSRRFAGFSEKSFFKKNKSEIWAKYGLWCYHFKFLEEIRLHWLFHRGFGEIRFLKWHDVINSNYWFLAILRVFRFVFIQSIFFLKLNRILTKIDISCVRSYHQSARPTHPLASIWSKLWEDSIYEWPLKQTGLVFALILKLSKLHGRKHKCALCWMKDQ